MQSEIAGASSDPNTALRRMRELEKAGTSIDEVKDNERRPFLNAKLAAAIILIAQGNLSKQINLMVQCNAITGKFMTGKQMLFLVYHQYGVG